MPEGKYKQPVHYSDVSSEVWYEGTDREIHGRALSDVGGPAQIGFGLLDLGPGSNTAPAHYHTLEEEHLYVIEGEALLHLGKNLIPLETGSYVCFPAGQPLGHYLENRSTERCRYVIVGQRIAGDEVIYSGDTSEPGSGHGQ